MPGQFSKAGNINLCIFSIIHTIITGLGAHSCLLAETVLRHSLSHDSYIKPKHKSDYPPVSFFRPKIINCTQIVGGRGSDPDPAEGAHEAPKDPLFGWGGGLFP
jgi:hypothetical protein